MENHLLEGRTKKLHTRDELSILSQLNIQLNILSFFDDSGLLAFQAFESPYQTAVRDATLAQFDEQAAIRQQAIKDQQAQLGVLGSGRAGIQSAEYQRKSDMDRASSHVRVRAFTALLDPFLSLDSEWSLVSGTYERTSVSFPPDVSAQLTERSLTFYRLQMCEESRYQAE